MFAIFSNSGGWLLLTRLGRGLRTERQGMHMHHKEEFRAKSVLIGMVLLVLVFCLESVELAINK